MTTFVQVEQRVCKGFQNIAGLSTTVPAALTIPAGANAAEIQADGGVVRMKLDALVAGATAVSATEGSRIDDGISTTVDSTLTGVRLLAVAASTNVQIQYFDRP